MKSSNVRDSFVLQRQRMKNATVVNCATICFGPQLFISILRYFAMEFDWELAFSYAVAFRTLLQ